MLKVLSFCTVVFGSMLAFQACDKNDDIAAPQSVQKPTASAIEMAEEINDDAEAGARAAAPAPILKENKVYQVFKVSGMCSTTVTTASAQIAVVSNHPGNSRYSEFNAAATLPDSLIKSKYGWSSFSVKPVDFEKYKKKTIDKTLGYVVYTRDRDAKIWRKGGSWPLATTTFAFLPNYLSVGTNISCGDVESLTLE